MQAKYDELKKSFKEHEGQVKTLQRRAVEEIVSDVQTQEGLTDDEADWVEDYLRDPVTVYRIFRRQRFISSFTHETLRKAVLWRLGNIKPAVLVSNAQRKRPELANLSTNHPGIKYLPRTTRDSLGRPVAILRVARLDAQLRSDLDQLKKDVILSLEWMRVVLHEINADLQRRKPIDGQPYEPVLQYAVVVDLKDVSIRTIPVELVSWYLKEVQPWYNGVVGSALVVNYSWTHSGLWRILKLLLPASMIAKVMFPSDSELSTLVPEDCIRDIFETSYSDPSSSPLSTTVHPQQQQQMNAASSLPSPPLTPPPQIVKKPVLTINTTASNLTNAKRSLTPAAEVKMKKEALSRFSTQNPFFGYPVSLPTLRSLPSLERLRSSLAARHPSSLPTLKHGRRRKRDLIRTLMLLYWLRWRERAIALSIFLLVSLLLIKAVQWSTRGRRGEVVKAVTRQVRLWAASRHWMMELTNVLNTVGSVAIA